MVKFASVATSQSTIVEEGVPPPFRGSPGVKRVHNTTLLGHGSPEATPSLNGFKLLVVWARPLRGNHNPWAPRASAAALIPLMAKKFRRLIQRWSQLPVMLKALSFILGLGVPPAPACYSTITMAGAEALRYRPAGYFYVGQVAILVVT